MLKRGQVTIFIIVALLIIASVSLFFLFRKGGITKIGVSEEKDLEGFLTTCLSSRILEGINTLGLQGGFIENPHYKEFKFEEDEESQKISFLCYNKNYYLPCINQEPMLVQRVKDELKNYIKDDAEACFNELVLSLSQDGYEITKQEYNGIDVSMTYSRINVNMKAKITTSKAEETLNYENFKIITPSRFYELVLLAQEIVSQEARYCHFEDLGYMLLYPEFEIDKFRTSDSILIYTLGKKKSEERFRFAVRGCVMPPGL